MGSSSREPKADVPARGAATGALVLVVGPSGAGKDTLIDVARLAFADDDRVVFARRAITRSIDAGGEPHLPMSIAAFEAAERAGQFALTWRSHGLAYGIPSSIEADVAAGRIVVANVSRGVLAAAARIASRRVVVHVTAPPDVLARRLALRGREDGSAVASRLARVASVDPSGAALVEIDNGGSVDAAGAAMIQVIAGLIAAPPVDAPR